MRLLIVAALLLCTANDNLAAPSTHAARLGETPVIDGDVLNDKAWTQFSSAMEFTQQQPQEGLPASQQTKVLIGFSNTHLYVAFVCYDDSPDEIIVTSQNRDASLGNSDSFTIRQATVNTEWFLVPTQLASSTTARLPMRGAADLVIRALI